MHKYLLIITLMFGNAFATEQDVIFKEGQKAFSNKAYKNAYSIWLPLAKDGYVAAQDTIGYLYSNGLGVEKSHKEAVNWYKKAAEKNHLEAMFNLANAYRLGRGITKDTAAAEELYRNSLCSGYKVSIIGMVALYATGNLQPKTEVEERALKKDLERLKAPSYRQWLIKVTRENISPNKSLNRTCYATASHAR